MIFAATHLLGISFAPRIKIFKDQQLYSFESPSVLKALGYQVLPKKKINTKIIHEQWDNILWFIATNQTQRDNRLTIIQKTQLLFPAASSLFTKALGRISR
jgi:TnpA family transposase